MAIWGQIKNGFRGQRLFNKYIKAYNLNLMEDWVVLLPDDDEQTNYLILKYLNQFYKRIVKDKDKEYKRGGIRSRKEKVFLVLSDDENVIRFGQDICHNIIAVEHVPHKQIWDIITSHAMYPVSDRLVIGTFEGLSGRGGMSALKSIGITKTEIIGNGILHINSKIERFQMPDFLAEYKVNDKNELSEYILRNEENS